MSARTLIVASLLAGCGRLGFDRHDAADAATVEPNCWPAWQDGTIDFEPPTRIALVTAQMGQNPSLSASGLELYFNVVDTDSEVVVATRPTRGAAWSARSPVNELNTAANERRVSLSGDGLTAIVATDRGGDMDLWLATRAAPGDPFDAPSPALLAAVNKVGSDELDPELSPDGLRVYLSYQRTATKFLMVAERADPDDVFTQPVTLFAVGPTTPFESDPTVDPNQLVLVFTRESAATMGDLYVAIRPDRDTPFGAPRLLPSVNTASKEGDGELSADGCELYFGSNRSGSEELHVARARM